MIQMVYEHGNKSRRSGVWVAYVCYKHVGLGLIWTWLKVHSPLPTHVALSSVNILPMNLSFLMHRMSTTALHCSDKALLTRSGKCILRRQVLGQSYLLIVYHEAPCLVPQNGAFFKQPFSAPLILHPTPVGWPDHFGYSHPFSWLAWTRVCCDAWWLANPLPCSYSNTLSKGTPIPVIQLKSPA